MGKLVLLVDDDRLPMRTYVRALEQNGFTVKHCLEPDGALEYLKEKGTMIAAVIVDIMLPPGKTRYTSHSTNYGLTTGLLIMEDVRKQLPTVPLLVLTNVRNPDTLEKAGKFPSVAIFQKMECSAFELARRVRDLIERQARGEDAR